MAGFYLSSFCLEEMVAEFIDPVSDCGCECIHFDTQTLVSCQLGLLKHPILHQNAGKSRASVHPAVHVLQTHYNVAASKGRG